MTGVVLVALGLAVLAESCGMPRLEERRINPWTVPGLVPGLLGIVIALLGAAMALRSSFAGAFRPRRTRDDSEAADASAARTRLFWSLALCLAYAVLLVGRMPFWLATGLFIFAFVAGFEWRNEDEQRARLAKIAAAGALAAATALAVPFLFEHLFLVRLP
jgi:putative tricarboxylic transport membrane protein